MTSSLPTAPRSKASALAALVIVALAIGGGAWLWKRSPTPTPRAAPGDVVLDATFDLAKGASDRRILSPGSSVFDIEVASNSSVRVTVGPPLPSTREAEGGPDPELGTVVRTLMTLGGAAKSQRFEVRVYGAGIYVVRVEPAAPPATGDARVRIRRRAGS